MTDVDGPTDSTGSGLAGVPRNRSLLRAIQVVRVLSDAEKPLTVAELTRLAAMPRATVNRILATLSDAGLVERVEATDCWTLGYELVRLARRADPYRDLAAAVEPMLAAVARDTGESAMLGVPRTHLTVEVVLQVDGPQLVGASHWVGRSFALHASAFGKLLLAEFDDDEILRILRADPPRRLAPDTRTDRAGILAELHDVRRLGYAQTIDELEDGLTGVAVPVRDADGHMIAMLGVSGPTFRVGADAVEFARTRLTTIAAQLHRDLHWR